MKVEKYVVTGYIEDVGTDTVRYIGDSELEAYRVYKRVKPEGNAKLVRALVDWINGSYEGHEDIKVIKQDTTRLIRDSWLEWSPYDEFFKDK